MAKKSTSEDIEQLLEQLNCEHGPKCQDARRALVNMGSQAVPALMEALHSKKHWVHWEAAKALAQIADPASTQALVAALVSRDFSLRWMAAEGLVSIGRPALVPLLQALIERPHSVWLRDGAYHVLSDIDRDGLDDIIDPVINALSGVVPSLEVPVAAQKALAALGQTR